MEFIWVKQLSGLGEDKQPGELADSILGAYMRHALAIVLHLVFVISLLVPFSWRICRFCTLWPESSVLEPTYSKKLQYGITHKMALLSCVSLSVLYCILGIWSPLYWWLGERPKDIGAEGEYVFQAIAWAIISVYAHYSLNKESKEKFPLLLRMWWMLLLIVYVYFLFLNIHEMRDQNHMTPSIVVEIVAFFLSAFLCYAGFCGRTGKSSLSQSIKEPLLNNIPENSEKHKPKITPYATASFLSRMSFSWIKPLLDVGHNKALDIDDVPQLVDVHKADHVYHKFRNQLDTECSGSSLAKKLLLIVIKDVLFTGLLMLMSSCSSYVGPYFIDNFVQCLAKREQFASEGITLACVFLLAKLVESLSQCHLTFKTVHICIYIRAALTASLYKKGLMLSSLSRQKHTSGEIINYMSVDAQRIEEFSWYVHEIWAVPLQILLAMVILYQNLGLASLAGLAATVLIMMANYPLVKMQEKYNKKIMEEKDNRMKATSETLRNMRILKLQAWESRFLLKLETMRGEECSWLKKYFFAFSGTTFIFWAAPTIVSVVTFGTCIIIGVPLTTGRILSALATFKILKEPINNLPDLISVIARSKVSLDRVANFLKQEELQQDAVDKVSKDSTDLAIEIEEGVFSWDPRAPTPTIRGLDVHIKRGMRVAVCGTVGSGKSSFLSCILGEIPKMSGVVKISGTKAYVSQAPWIQSGKIRKNILFGKEWEKPRYESVLQACAFKKDLELFPYGDQTEIGERGINLSGGQKQRIQLARALYQDADIYLFDDPFSAVDAHTGTYIFQECLLGMLGSKTVIYVTHQVEFLFAADLILVMRDGEITQAGKYEDILQSNTHFEELVGAHEKALKSINHMENSVILSSQLLLEGSSSDNKTSVEAGIHEHLQVEEKAHEEIESKNQRENEKDKEDRSSQLVQEEEREKGRVSMWVYWSYITAAYKGALVPIILLAHTVFQLLQIGSNYWMAWATPSTEDQRPPVTKSVLILVYVTLALCSSLCILVRTILLCVTGFESAKQLFRKMHSCIFRAPMSFDATPTGRILNRASNDQSQVDQVIPFQLGSVAFIFIELLGIIAIMSQVAWQVFLMFIPVLAICIWYQQYYIVTSRELSRLIGVCKAPVIQHFAESISGASTIRSFDQESTFMDTNLQLIDISSKPRSYKSGAMQWLSFRLDLLSNLIFVFTMVLLLCLPEGVINPSIAGLAVTYGLSLNLTQTLLIWYLCNLENNMISVERIVQYSRISSEPPLIIGNCGLNSCWPSRGTIDITNLQVRYGLHLPLVLKGISCTFPGGKKIGIVGRTGCGKSTLIQSLFRIVDPVGGRIVIDGIDILTVGLHDLRSRLSIIPQDPTMFEGTIRNNLDPLGDYSDDQIWKALQKCQLGQIVQLKEEKLDSLVTENGENWSMGQRQLVCLGRVLLKQSRILVLDEATASVDTATDGLIQQTIQNQFRDCTVITIAHRIPSVCDSDLVLVLSDGHIVEYDSPTKLLENKSSSFAKLVSEYTVRSTNIDGR